MEHKDDYTNPETQGEDATQPYDEAYSQPQTVYEQPESSYTYTQPQQTMPQKKQSNGTAVIITALITALVCLSAVLVLIGIGIIKINNGNNQQAQGNDEPQARETEKPQNTIRPTYAPGEEPSNNLIYSDDKDVTGSGDTEFAVLDKCIRSIVSINVEVVSESYFGNTVQSGAGSGVIITKDGYIATCFHVIEGATTIKCSLQDGKDYEAEIVGYDSRTDIAVLKIDAKNLPAATIGDSASHRVGEQVYAIGNPLGEFASTVTDGIISGVDRVIQVDGANMSLMQTNAAINPGNSGGGLFSAKTGELIGIVNAKSYGVEIDNIGFAIPTSTAKSIIKDIMDLGYVTGRPYLGVNVREVTQGQSFFFTSTYVIIESVLENSPADKAGLMANDLLISMGGIAVAQKTDVTSILNTYNAGDQIDIVVQRNGQNMNFTVELGESSSSK